MHRRRTAAWIARDGHLSSSVIIHDFHFVRFRFAPHKADAVLIVDSNAVLALAVALQGFQPVACRLTKIVEAIGVIEYLQFATRYLDDG
jgi:hypothetical protein